MAISDGQGRTRVSLEEAMKALEALSHHVKQDTDPRLVLAYSALGGVTNELLDMKQRVKQLEDMLGSNATIN